MLEPGLLNCQPQNFFVHIYLPLFSKIFDCCILANNEGAVMEEFLKWTGIKFIILPKLPKARNYLTINLNKSRIFESVDLDTQNYTLPSS